MTKNPTFPVAAIQYLMIRGAVPTFVLGKRMEYFESAWSASAQNAFNNRQIHGSGIASQAPVKPRLTAATEGGAR